MVYRTITERNACTADVGRQLYSYYVKNIMFTKPFWLQQYNNW